MSALNDFTKFLTTTALETFDNMVETAQKVLTGTSDVFSTSGVWNAVLGIADELKPFCYVVVALCLLIEIAQVAAKVDVVKWEHGLKLAIKMVLAKVCIDIAPTFLKACYNQANIWIGKVLAVGSMPRLGTIVSTKVIPKFDEVTGLWANLGLFVSVLIALLIVWILGLFIQAMALGRMFEIYVYLAVSPLPCAFFPLGDGNGGGMSRTTAKFFKSFVAVCLQGVMMVICIRVFGIIMGSGFEALINGASGDAASMITEVMFTMALAAIVLTVSIQQCGNWAKSIIDAM